MLGNVSRPKNGLLRGFTTLSAGILLSQLLLVVATPIISRLYSVTQIGEYAAVVAAATSLAPLLTLGLPRLIVPASSDTEAMYIASRAFRLSIGLSSSLFVLMLVTTVASEPLSTPSFGSVWLWLPGLVLAQCTFSVLFAVALRGRQYKLAAWRPLLQNTVIVATQVGLSLSGRGAHLLVVGETFGRTVGVVLLLRPYFLVRRSVQKQKVIRSFWRSHGATIARVWPATTLDVVATSVWVIAAAWWYGDQIAGYVGMTQRILAIPVALIGAALGQAILAEVSHSRRSNESIPSLRALIIGLTGLAVAVTLILTFMGPWLFATVLGADWRPAGEFAQLIAVPAAIGLLWNPLSTLLLALEKWGAMLLIAALRVSVGLGLGSFAYLAGADWFLSLALLVAGGATAQILGLYLIARSVRSLRAQAH